MAKKNTRTQSFLQNNVGRRVFTFYELGTIQEKTLSRKQQIKIKGHDVIQKQIFEFKKSNEIMKCGETIFDPEQMMQMERKGSTDKGLMLESF